MNEKINKTADTIIKSIKSTILASKKSNPERIQHFIEMTVERSFNRETKKWENYSFKFYGGKPFCNSLSTSEMRELGFALHGKIDELKKTRGWGNLIVKWEKETEFVGGWVGERTLFEYPCEITLLAEPCKEFVSLANYVKKYIGITLNPFDVWNGHIGGKRGIVYGDAYELRYLCHRSKKCESILAELRKVRGTNDKCSFAWKKEDDIDPWELQVSIRNEVEFEGIRRKYGEVTIKTPTGKEKGTIKIAA